MAPDEAVLFVDAVHPTHAARAAGFWTAKDVRPAIEQTTGRQRLNIHVAIDRETGQTRMIEAETIDAASTIKLLAGLEALYATTAPIHVFLDHARFHHAKIVQEWLSQPGRRIVLHFVPSFCPHLNPIERLWALMHQHLTHNKIYPTCREFADAILAFLRNEVPRRWSEFAIRSQTTSASSSPRNFGFWREPSILVPLFAIILLILAIYPRFVVTPGFPFFVKRSVRPEDFVTPPDDEKEFFALFRDRCAALAEESLLGDRSFSDRDGRLPDLSRHSLRSLDRRGSAPGADLASLGSARAAWIAA